MEKSANNFQKYIKDLYEANNEKKSWEEIFGFFSRTSGYLTRAIMRNKCKPDEFIKSISWLMALANKLDVNLEESLIRKYPTICPYCLTSPCACHRTGKSPEKPIPAHKIREELRAKYNSHSSHIHRDLESLSLHLQQIFPNNEIIWHFAGPWMICAKLFEETAELHEAIDKFLFGKKKILNIEEEFADVFAWLLNAWHAYFPERNLDDDFLDYYIENCPVCEKLPCECEQGESRIQGLPDQDSFAKIRAAFEKLIEYYPDKRELLNDVVASIHSAEENGDEPTARAAIREAKELLDGIRPSDQSEEEGTTFEELDEIFSDLE